MIATPRIVKITLDDNKFTIKLFMSFDFETESKIAKINCNKNDNTPSANARANGPKKNINTHFSNENCSSL